MENKKFAFKLAALGARGQLELDQGAAKQVPQGHVLSTDQPRRAPLEVLRLQP